MAAHRIMSYHLDYVMNSTGSLAAHRIMSHHLDYVMNSTGSQAEASQRARLISERKIASHPLPQYGVSQRAKAHQQKEHSQPPTPSIRSAHQHPRTDKEDIDS